MLIGNPASDLQRKTASHSTLMKKTDIKINLASFLPGQIHFVLKIQGFFRHSPSGLLLRLTSFFQYIICYTDKIFLQYFIGNGNCNFTLLIRKFALQFLMNDFNPDTFRFQYISNVLYIFFHQNSAHYSFFTYIYAL